MVAMGFLAGGSGRAFTPLGMMFPWDDGLESPCLSEANGRPGEARNGSNQRAKRPNTGLSQSLFLGCWDAIPLPEPHPQLLGRDSAMRHQKNPRARSDQGSACESRGKWGDCTSKPAARSGAVGVCDIANGRYNLLYCTCN